MGEKKWENRNISFFGQFYNCDIFNQICRGMFAEKLYFLENISYYKIAIFGGSWRGKIYSPFYRVRERKFEMRKKQYLIFWTILPFNFCGKIAFFEEYFSLILKRKDSDIFHNSYRNVNIGNRPGSVEEPLTREDEICHARSKMIVEVKAAKLSSEIYITISELPVCNPDQSFGSRRSNERNHAETLKQMNYG